MAAEVHLIMSFFLTLFYPYSAAQLSSAYLSVFFITALFRFNSHTIHVTHLGVQFNGFNIFRVVQPVPHFFGIKLIHNAILVSDIQHSDLIIIYISWLHSA